MVSVDKFLQGVDAIQATHPTYRTGGIGDDGTCDCVGLIIGALRRAGGRWNGLKGSNYVARHELKNGGLIAINSPGQLVRGMVVFKAKDDASNLPDRYKPGGSYYTGDLHDYYHIGIVYRTNPLVITHVTTNGGNDFVVDTKLGKWSHAGYLTLVDYDGTGDQYTTNDDTGGGKMTYIVDAEGGVNFRTKPNIKADRICTIPQETVVTAEPAGNGWLKVEYNGRTGYCVEQYLSELEDVSEVDDDIDLLKMLKELEARVTALENSVGFG